MKDSEVLYRQYDDGSIEAAGEVNDRALCEQNILILRPGVLYRFTAIPGCELCANIAIGYKESV